MKNCSIFTFKRSGEIASVAEENEVAVLNSQNLTHQKG